MDDGILLDVYHYVIQMNNILLTFFFIICIAYLIWRLGIHIYKIAVTPSGIHYINLKRQCVSTLPCYNPFFFDADFATANYSGIKCTLKSQKSCYIQGLWGVPIYPLFELLNGSWQSLINSVITDVPSEKFSSKCICANTLFILMPGEEKTLEFQPPWDISENVVLQEPPHLRTVYPFVLLMILKEENEMKQTDMVAMANAVHVPDTKMLLYSQLIGQYPKMLVGPVGQIKKIFCASPATSEDEEGYDLCLVCYHRPVTVVFLPCAHACLCNVCTDRCDKCPVCRVLITHYFEFPVSGVGPAY